MFGLVSHVRAIRQRSTKLLQLNLELAKVEAKQKATALGVAGGLAVAALIFVVYAIGFLFAAAAAGLSEAVPLWLALLIVGLILLLIAALGVFLAMRFARKASPPAPAQAIEESKATLGMLKNHG